MTVRGADRPGGHARQAQLERHHMRPFAAPSSTTGTVTSTNALHRDANPAAPPPFPQHSPRRRLGQRMPVRQVCYSRPCPRTVRLRRGDWGRVTASLPGTTPGCFRTIMHAVRPRPTRFWAEAVPAYTGLCDPGFGQLSCPAAACSRRFLLIWSRDCWAWLRCCWYACSPISSRHLARAWRGWVNAWA